MKLSVKTNRSDEYLEGFRACNNFVSRSRNPYIMRIAGAVVHNQAYQDWLDGWNKRFYGEEVNSEP